MGVQCAGPKRKNSTLTEWNKPPNRTKNIPTLENILHWNKHEKEKQNVSINIIIWCVSLYSHILSLHFTGDWGKWGGWGGPQGMVIHLLLLYSEMHITGTHVRTRDKNLWDAFTFDIMCAPVHKRDVGDVIHYWFLPRMRTSCVHFWIYCILLNFLLYLYYVMYSFANVPVYVLCIVFCTVLCVMYVRVSQGLLMDLSSDG